jgi:hypothetical protein
MTEQDLVRVVERSMRAHDGDAPSAETIRRRLDAVGAPPQVSSSRVRRWWPAVGVAVCVLLVVGATALWSPEPDSGDGPTAPSGRHSRLPSTRPVTIFLARYERAAAPHHRRWYLIPRQVIVPRSGNPGLDAARALFEYKPPLDRPDHGITVANGLANWFHLGSTPVAAVNSVHSTGGLITVDINRSLRDSYPGLECLCPDVETVLQQLAWTVSTALSSQQPITLTVNGRRASRLEGVRIFQGVPNPDAIATSHRAFRWYRQACGKRVIVAVAAGQRVDVPAPGNSLRPTGLVTLHVGDVLRFQVTGECFRPLAAGTDDSGVLGGVDGSEDPLTIVALRPGHAVASVGGGACAPSFTAGACLGPYVLAGSITVHVVRA